MNPCRCGATLLLLGIMICAGRVCAQPTATLEAELIIAPFPTPYVSDWESFPNIGSLTVTNISGAEQQFSIIVRVTRDDGCVIVNGQSNRQLIGPGAQLVYDQTSDIGGSVDYDDQEKDRIIRSGRFTEGEYSGCVRLIAVDGSDLSDEVCSDFAIVYPESPALVYPCEDQIEEQFPLFQWTPVQVPSDYLLSYRLRIVEVLAGQTPSDALQSNPNPLFEATGLTETNLQYPAGEQPFEPATNYAWQVQATDQDGFPVSTNQGWSDFCTFTFRGGAVEISVTDSLTGQPIADAEVTLGENTQQTDFDGVAEFEKLSIGVSRLTVVAPKQAAADSTAGIDDMSYLPVDRTIEILAGERQRFEISLVRTSLIRIVVADSLTQEPMSDATVQIAQSRVTTGANGVAQLLNIVPGRHRLRVQGPAVDATDSTSYLDSVTDLEVRAGQLIERTVFLVSIARELVASGRVVDLHSGEPIGGARINARDVYQSPFMIFGQWTLGTERVVVESQADGTFRIFQNPAGNTTRQWPYRAPCGVWMEIEKTDYFSEERGIWSCSGPSPPQFQSARAGTHFEVQLRPQHVPVTILAVSAEDDTVGLAQAQVQLESNAGFAGVHNVHVALTNERGIAVLPDVRVDLNYRIRISAGSAYHVADTTVQVTKPDTVMVRLRPKTGTIGGFVLARESSNPLSSAQVYLYHESDLSGYAPDSSQWSEARDLSSTEASYGPVMTTTSGAFSFEGVAINDPEQVTDRYIIWAKATAHHGAWGSARLSTDGQVVTDTLFANRVLGRIAGVVTRRSDNSPVEDAFVSLQPSSKEPGAIGRRPPAQSKRPPSAFTNPDGSFTLDSLELRKYGPLIVVGAGFSELTLEGIELSETTPQLELNLRVEDETGLVTGRVTTSDGSGLYNVGILSPSAPYLSVASTATDGSFRISNAPVGALELLFHKPGFADVRDTVQVVRNQEQILEISMQEYRGGLALTILDGLNDLPVPQARVSLDSLQRTTDNAGKAEFLDVPIGIKQLIITPPADDPEGTDYRNISTSIDITRDVIRDTTITLQRGARISGVVRAQSSSQGISGVRIAVEGSNDLAVVADDDGTFTLRNLPANENLLLSASKIGFVSASAEITALNPGEHRSDIEFVLREAPITRIWGFEVEIAEMKSGNGSNQLISGAFVNIPGNSVLQPDGNAKIYFDNMELDSGFNPVRDSNPLATTEFPVKIHGFSAALKDTTGSFLTLEWDRQNLTGMIKPPEGGVQLSATIFRDIPGSEWAEEIVVARDATTAIGFWGDKTYYGLDSLGISPINRPARMKILGGYPVKVDYSKSRIDASGLHYSGSFAFPEIDSTIAIQDLNIIASTSGAAKFAGAFVAPIDFRFDTFLFDNQEIVWNETGLRIAGKIVLPENGGKEFAFSELQIASDARFVNLVFDNQVTKGTIGVYGSQFKYKTLQFGETAADRKKKLSFTGGLDIKSTLADVIFRDPINMGYLNHTQDGKFDGEVAFNQDVVFMGVTNVQVKAVAFESDGSGSSPIGGGSGQASGPSILVDGGIAFVIPGLDLHTGHFHFYENGFFQLDTVAVSLEVPNVVDAFLSLSFIDNEFKGAGALKIIPLRKKAKASKKDKAVIDVEGSFRYRDATSWEIMVMSKLPFGGIKMGPLAITKIGGKLGTDAGAWTVGLYGTFEPTGGGKISKLDPFGMEVTAGGGEAIVRILAKLVFAEDAGMQPLDTEIFYNHKKRLFKGIIKMDQEWPEGAGLVVIDMSGTVTLAIKGEPGSYWYFGGGLTADFLRYRLGEANLYVGNNYKLTNHAAPFNAVRWHTDNPTLHGLHFDAYMGIPSINFVVYGFDFSARSFLDVNFKDLSMAGGLRLWGRAWFDLYIGSGSVSILLESVIGVKDKCLQFYGHGDFDLLLKLGWGCGNRCRTRECYSCNCKWNKPWCCIPTGASVCVDVSVTAKYDCYSGWQFGASGW